MQVGMVKAKRAKGSTKALLRRAQRAQKADNVAKTKQEEACTFISVKVTTCSGTGSKPSIE